MEYIQEFSLAEQSTGLISGILGMNDGYVSDGHNGANFYAFSFGLEREITEELLVFGHGMQSFAIDSNPAFAGDDQLKDFFILESAFSGPFSSTWTTKK